MRYTSVLLLLLASTLAAGPAQAQVVIDGRPVVSIRALPRAVAPAPEDVCIYRATGRTAGTFVRVPPHLEGAALRTQQQASSTISIDYEGGFPEPAQAALRRAANIWEMHIASPVPISVRAAWVDTMGTNTLASAGSNLIFAFEFANGETIAYSSALTDALTGQDAHGTVPASAPEIVMYVNATRDDWYFGTGTPGPDEIDFTTVALHEIGHGLGFYGSMKVENSLGRWGYDFNTDAIDGPVPAVYDVSLDFDTGALVSAVQDAQGNRLTDTAVYPNSSAALGDVLTGGAVFFDGPKARAGASSNERPALFAPTAWNAGSSYSHLDESTYPAGDVNALMTPYVDFQEVIRSPGGITCGMLADMGWPLGPGCAAFFDSNADVIPIAEARDQGVGATVTVQGVVTRAYGDFVRLQDTSGPTDASALVVRQTSGDFFDDIQDGTIQPGTVLQVSGMLSPFNGLLQINEGDLDGYSIEGQTAVPAPQTITLADLKANGGDYVSELVKIAGLSFANASGTFSNDRSYDVSDGATTLTFRVQGPDETALGGTPIPPGVFTYVGIAGIFFPDYFDSPSYQLIPIRPSDLRTGPYVRFSGRDYTLALEADAAVELTVRAFSLESGQTAEVTASVAAVSGPTAANYGTDVTGSALPTTFTLTAGDPIYTLTLEPQDDGMDEGVERLEIIIESEDVPVASGRSTVWILDSDTATTTLYAGLEGEALREQIRADFGSPPTLGYDVARDTLYSVIFNEGGSVFGFYTGYEATLDGGDPSEDVGDENINTEHTWPRSYGAEEEPRLSNMHILVPAWAEVNAARCNYPYAEIDDSITERWFGAGVILDQPPSMNLDAYSESVGNDCGSGNYSESGRFEPREVVKGNVARKLFYFRTIYPEHAGFSFFAAQVATLRDWNGQDAPSAEEVRRNILIASYQGNELNPFVLDPSLAERAYADILEPTPIAEVREQPLGASITARGLVTRIDADGAYLQGESAAIYVFDSSVADVVSVGDSVRVTGTLDAFAGLLEITDVVAGGVTVLSSDHPLPEPQTVTLAELTANGEQYEAELIRIENLTFADAGGTFDGGVNYAVSDGSGGDIELRVPGASFYAGASIPDEATTFTGVLGQYNGGDVGDREPDEGYQPLAIARGDLEGVGGGNTAPSASFTYTPESPAAGVEVSFDASASSDPDGSIASYEWTFGDGEGSSGETVTHTYAADGDYDVILTVTDEAGATATATQTVIVGTGGNEPTVPPTVGVNVEIPFGDLDDPQSYRLVALPGDVNQPLDQTLSGLVGRDWQAYLDNGAATDYLVKWSGSDRFHFRPGRGFWLVSEDAWTVNATFETLPLESGAVEISLHDGWNIISNPLDTAVVWSSIEAANGGALQPIFSFNGSYQQASTFASAKTGRAYYFLNDGGLDALTIPYPTGGESSAQQRASAASVLTLTAYQEGRPTAAVRVGTASRATDGLDAGDHFAPPARFAGTTLRLSAPAAISDKRRQWLVQELRAPAEGHIFDLVLHTDAPGQAVTVRASGFATLGEKRQAVLVAEATGRRFHLRTDGNATPTPRNETTRLHLVVGTKAFVEARLGEMLPEALRVLPNHPNPFRSSTTIEYVLPEARHVRVEVYDVLGRRVAVLVDERQSAGPHTLTWGRSTGTARLAGGIYFVRFTAGPDRHTQRVVLVR